ncbi:MULTISPECIES: hypothetical protein [Psychrilyobacter]|uniref:Methyl-accepting chemotaxis protein n=1 Tax=Psychrilyobacter piezotolerans TaxID=2293438 RepID=A0ABX9KHY5_9FUSO|nr:MULTISPECIES: hypothetical protein [Psychrilyobacter]MCS5420722.1 hypothetical protein [Psychrilyobacter sp. S5]NDI78002.1 hypothetical protein [Psychrilyobacter piezotolerans]RDE61945.1 hypothetical protein DV867_08085 [Psychrilyobacter sp. S5]REI41171.1 hypothetical protein DYH56_08085 [Psychrilyobacter piezotolerans]
MSNIRKSKQTILGVIVSIIIIFAVASFYMGTLQGIINKLSETTKLKTEYKTTIEELEESND